MNIQLIIYHWVEIHVGNRAHLEVPNCVLKLLAVLEPTFRDRLIQNPHNQSFPKEISTFSPYHGQVRAR